jgi:hypothetical protein
MISSSNYYFKLHRVSLQPQKYRYINDNISNSTALICHLSCITKSCMLCTIYFYNIATITGLPLPGCLYMSLCLSVCTCLSVCLYMSGWLYMSVCLSVCTCLSIHLSICHFFQVRDILQKDPELRPSVTDLLYERVPKVR